MVFFGLLILVFPVAFNPSVEAAVIRCADLVIDAKVKANEPFREELGEYGSAGFVDDKQLRWQVTATEASTFSSFFEKLLQAEAEASLAPRLREQSKTTIARSRDGIVEWAQGAKIGAKTARKPDPDAPWTWLSIHVQKTADRELEVTAERGDERGFSDELSTYFSRQVGLPAAPFPRVIDASEGRDYEALEAALLQMVASHLGNEEGQADALRNRARRRMRQSLRELVTMKLMRESFFHELPGTIIPNDLNSLIARFDSSVRPLDLVDEGGREAIHPTAEEFKRWIKENAPASMTEALTRRWEEFRRHPRPHSGQVEWRVSLKPIETVTVELRIQMHYDAEVDALGEVSLKACALTTPWDRQGTALTARIIPRAAPGVGYPRKELLINQAQLLSSALAPTPPDAAPGWDFSGIPVTPTTSPQEPPDLPSDYFDDMDLSLPPVPVAQAPANSAEDLDLSLPPDHFDALTRDPLEPLDDDSHLRAPPRAWPSQSFVAGANAAYAHPTPPPRRLLADDDLQALAEQLMAAVRRLDILRGEDLSEFETKVYEWIVNTTFTREQRRDDLNALSQVVAEGQAVFQLFRAVAMDLQRSIGNHALGQSLTNVNKHLREALLAMVRSLGALEKAKLQRDRFRGLTTQLSTLARSPLMRSPGITHSRPIHHPRVSSVETRVHGRQLKPPRTR